MKLDLVRDVLDKQLVDRFGTMMGRADGVVIELRDGEPPVVDHLQLGAVVLAARVGRPAERLVNWFRQHVRVRRNAVQIIRWPLVAEMTAHHIKIDIDGQETEAFDWEKWLRKKIVERIPGASA